MAAGLVLGTWAAAAGESIYARANKTGTTPLHTDDTARKVGDLLTVVILEQSSVANTTSRDMEKKTTRSAALKGSFDLGNILSALGKKTYNLPNVDVSGSGDQKLEGKSEYDSSRKIADSVTVTVYDVLPNGNLVIMGTRKRQVDGDTQHVQISGIVRPSDIAFANTVPSSQIAEFQLVTSDQGQGSTATRPGWFAAILNVLSAW
jgi:flagellar L-ring protein precursor FlgH